jgi:hypothetical protein
MAGKFIQLALLIAGLFLSINSFAASDDGSSCRQKSELGEEADVRFIGATSCAELGSVFTGNDHCQVRKSPSSGCQIDNYGVPVGLGYYFTGCLAGTNCSENHQPLPPVEIPVPRVLPSVAVVPVTQADLANPTGMVYFTNMQTELNNQRILSQEVLDNIYQLFTATNSLSSTTHNNIINSKHEILNSVSSRTSQLSNNMASLTSQLSYTHNNLYNTIRQEAVQAAQNEVFATNKILDAIADKDDLLNKLDGIDNEIAAVGNTLNYVAIAQQASELRDEAIAASVNQTLSISSNLNETTLDTRDKVNQLEQTINAIANEVVSEPCGGRGLPDCPPDDGGGVDLTETNQLLNEILSQDEYFSTYTQQTNQILNQIKSQDAFLSESIKNTINNLPDRSDAQNSTSQIINSVNGLHDTLNGNHSDRAGQLAQYHSEIKQALSSIGSVDGSGGSTDDDTLTNEKLDVINESLNGLGQKLDGISSGIDGLSDSFAAGSGQKSGPEKCTGAHCWKSHSWIDTSYEEGMKTVWDEHMMAFNASGMKTYLNSLYPQIGGSGGLQPLQICFDMGFVNFGCFAITIPPYVIAFLRICLLISASFYCQRLIFGGA